VSDGDTLTVRDKHNQTHRIRLADIDAPEQAQAFGTQAKLRLSEKVFNQDVTVRWQEKDQYGRIAGHVILDGNDVNCELVAEGYAWHYKFHSRDRDLAAAEAKARQQKLGLWRDKNRTPPWDFRRAHPREN
jgi:endonuclease YncB( thermonuclease family)